MPCQRPRVCPHCGTVGSLKILPQLVDEKFRLVSMARGEVVGIRIPNFYCSLASCRRALFSLSKCIAYGDSTMMPSNVVEPSITDEHARGVAFTAGHLWPGSPVSCAEATVVFEYEVLNWIRSMLLQ